MWFRGEVFVPEFCELGLGLGLGLSDVGDFHTRLEDRYTIPYHTIL